MTPGYWLAVAAGGALGAVGRAGVAATLPSEGAFPLQTYVVNVLGSFVIGLVWAGVSRPDTSVLWSAFIVTGILGGFTTFSTFSLETLQLLEQGAWRTACLYLFLSLLTCVGGAGAGVMLCRLVAH